MILTVHTATSSIIPLLLPTWVFIWLISFIIFTEETEKPCTSPLHAAQELAKYIGVESEFGAWTIESLEGTTMKRDTISHAVQ